MLFGKYTVADLSRFIKATDAAVDHVQKRFTLISAPWGAEDVKAMHAWQADWTALQARYNAAKEKAGAVMARATWSGLDPALDTDPDDKGASQSDVAYRQLVRSLHKVPDKDSPGDLKDLARRLPKWAPKHVGNDYGQDTGQLVFQQNVAQTDQDILDAGNAALLADPPIGLSTGQSISQWWMQATGQLNSSGTGPGPGFWGSSLGFLTIGAIAVGAVVLVGPVVTPVIVAGMAKPKG
jgi:hypothetical protein